MCPATGLMVDSAVIRCPSFWGRCWGRRSWGLGSRRGEVRLPQVDMNNRVGRAGLIAPQLSRGELHRVKVFRALALTRRVGVRVDVGTVRGDDPTDVPADVARPTGVRGRRVRTDPH